MERTRNPQKVIENHTLKYADMAQIEVAIYDTIQEKHPTSIRELCSSIPGHEPKKVLAVYKRMRKYGCVFYKKGCFTIGDID